MFLPNRDIQWAIECGYLIVNPRPEQFGCGYDEPSIDLHLDKVQEANVWDVKRFTQDQQMAGHGPELRLGRFQYGSFAKRYLVNPPVESNETVYRRGNEVMVKPGGFVLWTTKEQVGTPVENPRLLCFVNAKSTRARTGVLVHLTAPTIHAGWNGKIVLEIANLGPFHLVLQEDDVIAQLTVATIASPPDLTLKKSPSQTTGQGHATGESR
jgi:deoxycytidine triphosphate deaminase